MISTNIAEFEAFTMQQNQFALKYTATAVILAFAAATSAIHAQEILHATGPLPTFEVATIKLAGPDTGASAAMIAEGAATDKLAAAPTTDGGEKVTRTVNVFYSLDDGPPSDRVEMTIKTRTLIRVSYGLPSGTDSRVVGGPAWLDGDKDRYEINGKIDETQFAAMQKMSPAEQDRHVRLMQQSLLADRFHLKVHFETRDLPVYALTIAKGGPKMNPAKPGESPRLKGTGDGQNNTLTAYSMTMAEFIHSPLLRPEGRMVIDRTGLTAAYDFTLKSSIAGDPDSTGPSLFTALEEQLGLKLVATKAPLEVIVIDHIDRPDAN
ncbi:MAG TPA: TIGR03435 family protein [Acidobacteriaceae bacterium]|nr:TIGR03435 family protein [Acidobacteriaceae bacterium]